MSNNKNVKVVKADPSRSRESESEMDQMPLHRANYVGMAVSLVLIVVGFALMAGSANEGATFNYDIFESRRTVVGPLIAFAGFIAMAFAIIAPKRSRKDDLLNS